VKKNSVFALYLIISVIFVLSGVIFSQANGKTGFSSPLKGDTIVDRRGFVVSLEIGNFDNTTGYYWVAIASVTGHGEKWESVMQLYNESRNGQYEARKEINKIISEWQIDQFWPKFYIPKNSYENHVFDGGSNPLSCIEPQPMILLIIKVDDKLHNKFIEWFKKGKAGHGFPGYSASILSDNMILARCEIFFR
jgi:hypothetical protein